MHTCTHTERHIYSVFTAVSIDSEMNICIHNRVADGVNHVLLPYYLSHICVCISLINMPKLQHLPLLCDIYFTFNHSIQHFDELENFLFISLLSKYKLTSFSTPAVFILCCISHIFAYTISFYAHLLYLNVKNFNTNTYTQNVCKMLVLNERKTIERQN